jgi:hypothetical protein
MAKSECIEPLGNGRDSPISTAQRRALAASEELNVKAPLAEALSCVVEHVSNFDLTTLGRRPRVFCASMADVFDNAAPPRQRERLFTLNRGCSRSVSGTRRGCCRLIGTTAMLTSGSGVTIVNQHEVDRDLGKLRPAPGRR